MASTALRLVLLPAGRPPRLPSQSTTHAPSYLQFTQTVQGTLCLSRHRGQVVSRNSCENPWQKILDARVAKKFDTVHGQGLELSVEFFNLLNGLKSE